MSTVPVPRPPLVLLAEDDDDLRIALLEALVSEGFEAMEARSGPEALASVRKRAPDAALVDLHMPGESDQVLAEDLRRHAPSLRVVVMSGDHHAPVPGGMPMLKKPFALSGLLEQLHRVLASESRPL